MAWLNGGRFENPVEMHGKPGDICIETGYEKELLFARHCPPDGVYWLFISHWSLKQMEEHKACPREWKLIQVGTVGIGALRSLRWLFGGTEPHIDWYDFEQANWRGPVDLPAPPTDDPAGFAVRR